MHTRNQYSYMQALDFMSPVEVTIYTNIEVATNTISYSYMLSCSYISMATQLMDHYKCIYLLGNSDQLLWLQEYLIDEANDRRTDGMVPGEPICTCNSVVLLLLN